MLKVVIGLFGAALLLGVGFYVWMVVAFEPPKPAGPQDLLREVKAGELKTETGQGVAWRITWRAANEKSARTYELSSGLRDATGPQQWLRVTGKPAPVDVRVARKQVLEVMFDGPLPDGSSSMLFEMDEGWRRTDLVDLENGKRTNGQ
jgi:hypothetical protein